jgi:hypothetical protein
MSSKAIIDCEPSLISFQDVRINQNYVATLTLRNTLSASLDLTIRPSSARYTVSPNRIHMSPRQSIVCTVRFSLSRYPANWNKGVQHGMEDYLLLKSDYFDQRIPCEYFLSSSGVLHSAVTTRSRSQSPSRAHDPDDLLPPPPPTIPVHCSSPHNNNNSASYGDGSRGHQSLNSSELLHDLRIQLDFKDRTINELRGSLNEMQSQSPIYQQIVNTKLDQERRVFEEKSEKVSFYESDLLSMMMMLVVLLLCFSGAVDSAQERCTN